MEALIQLRNFSCTLKPPTLTSSPNYLDTTTSRPGKSLPQIWGNIDILSARFKQFNGGPFCFPLPSYRSYFLKTVAKFRRSRAYASLI
jgi:hypothetical protein